MISTTPATAVTTRRSTGGRWLRVTYAIEERDRVADEHDRSTGPARRPPARARRTRRRSARARTATRKPAESSAGLGLSGSYRAPDAHVPDLDAGRDGPGRGWAGHGAGEPAPDLERASGPGRGAARRLRRWRGRRAIPSASAAIASPAARDAATSTSASGCEASPRRSTTTRSRGRCGPSSSRTITVPVRAVAGQCTSRIGSPSTYSRTPRVTSWPVALARGRACASRSEPLARLVARPASGRGATSSGPGERDAEPAAPADEAERARAAHLDDDPREHAALERDDGRGRRGTARRRGTRRSVPVSVRTRRPRAWPRSSMLTWHRPADQSVAGAEARTETPDERDARARPRAMSEHRDEDAQRMTMSHPAPVGARDEVQRDGDDREDDARSAEGCRSRQPPVHGWGTATPSTSVERNVWASRSVAGVAQQEAVGEHRDARCLTSSGTT